MEHTHTSAAQAGCSGVGLGLVSLVGSALEARRLAGTQRDGPSADYLRVNQTSSIHPSYPSNHAFSRRRRAYAYRTGSVN